MHAAVGALTLGEGLSVAAGLFGSNVAVRAEMLSSRAIAVPIQISTAIPKTEIAQQIKNLSVLIKGQAGSGSGVIVQHQGQTYTVVTAVHVVSLLEDFRL
jgi:lipid-binding SYLF domain-containing protein